MDAHSNPARRTLKSVQEQEDRRRRRNERDRAWRAAETAEQRSEILSKRRERNCAKCAAQTASERQVTSQQRSTRERERMAAKTPENDNSVPFKAKMSCKHGYIGYTNMLYLFRKISCMALFHPKPNKFLRFDLESCNLMCTYTVVTHPCHIPPLAQARPMMLCIYTSTYCGLCWVCKITFRDATNHKQWIILTIAQCSDTRVHDQVEER